MRKRRRTLNEQFALTPAILLIHTADNGQQAITPVMFQQFWLFLWIVLAWFVVWPGLEIAKRLAQRFEDFIQKSDFSFSLAEMYYRAGLSFILGAQPGRSLAWGVLRV
ncbi:MAG: hypothetical protein EHM12_11575 [Dehalococcoidia bacterium]|nr:MAG: hypothetical protein EHM12_11575 [Dehalococcoidia bacterium]